MGEQEKPDILSAKIPPSHDWSIKSRSRTGTSFQNTDSPNISFPTSFTDTNAVPAVYLNASSINQVSSQLSSINT